MLTATVIRRLESIGQISEEGKVINGLFRLMEEEVLWWEAYSRIYANKGAVTKGINNNTLDGFSQQRIVKLIGKLSNGTYRPEPTRRVYIPKANGKKRPLGIPTGDDKLVQEVVRIILERIYEPVFLNTSHGFRQRRSTHTALHQIERTWNGVKWIVNVDIASFFDSMNHQVLLAILAKKIGDKRFLTLIDSLLKAGYLEDWKFHTTYSGCPQGGICSPILSNIYLNELDAFMVDLIEEFNKGKRRKKNALYDQYCQKIAVIRSQVDKGTKDLSTAKEEITELEKVRKSLTAGDPFDPGYKRLLYCRYADDFVIGLIGSKAEAIAIMEKVKEFLVTKLKLNISETKTHIVHAKDGTGFLGYTIKIYSACKTVRIKRGNRYTLMRSIAERMQLYIPQGRLEKFSTNKKYGNYQTLKALHRGYCLNLSEAEIISIYNAELRGLANYYSLAHSVKSRINKLYHIWKVSLFKTLAAKRKKSVTKVANSLKLQNGDSGIQFQAKGKLHTIKLFRPKTWEIPSVDNNKLDLEPRREVAMLKMSRTELIQRIKANKCEYCSTTTGPFEVHHVRGMKSLKPGKQHWQQVMITRNRKTLVLCVSCHKLLSCGRLPSRKLTDVKDC